MRRWIVLLAVLATACGGGNGTPSSPTPQPYNQTLTGTVSVFGTTSHQLTVPRAGNMSITLAWSGSADLDLYLTNSGCSEFAVLATCTLHAAADGLVNPERVQRTVTANEAFKVWVDNFSNQSVNYSLTIRVE